MQEFIVLFKGVNVGGKNLLPMKPFVNLLENNNYRHVSSYIQSGNVVLTCAKDPTKNLKSIVNQHYGFTPELFILQKEELASAFEHCPYNEYEGKFVHYYFCHQPITLNKDKIHQYIAETEAFTVKGNTFYLYAPNGIGKSKLVANIAVCLDQTSTGRNLNTVNKILLMLS